MRRAGSGRRSAWPVGIFGILGCLYLLYSLPQRTQIWFLGAHVVGLAHLSRSTAPGAASRARGGLTMLRRRSSAVALLCLRRPGVRPDPGRSRAGAAPLSGSRWRPTRARSCVELETVRAPITARNFLRYVDQRRLDGDRLLPGDAGRRASAGLIQGGVRDPRRLFPPIAHEPTSQTGLTHSTARSRVPRFAPGTAQGDFTIMVGAADLSRRRARPAAATISALRCSAGWSKGMDVVRAHPRRADLADRRGGVMRGQMLCPRIRIVTARRAPALGRARTRRSPRRRRGGRRRRWRNRRRAA